VADRIDKWPASRRESGTREDERFVRSSSKYRGTTLRVTEAEDRPGSNGSNGNNGSSSSSSAKGIIPRVSEERVSNYRRIALHSVRRAWLAPSKSNSFRTLGADLPLAPSTSPCFLLPLSPWFKQTRPLRLSPSRHCEKDASTLYPSFSIGFSVLLYFSSFYLSLLSASPRFASPASAIPSPRRLLVCPPREETSNPRTDRVARVPLSRAALPLGKSTARMHNIISIAKNPRRRRRSQRTRRRRSMADCLILPPPHPARSGTVTLPYAPRGSDRGRALLDSEFERFLHISSLSLSTGFTLVSQR